MKWFDFSFAKKNTQAISFRRIASKKIRWMWKKRFIIFFLYWTQLLKRCFSFLPTLNSFLVFFLLQNKYPVENDMKEMWANKKSNTLYVCICIHCRFYTIQFEIFKCLYFVTFEIDVSINFKRVAYTGSSLPVFFFFNLPYIFCASFSFFLFNTWQYR